MANNQIKCVTAALKGKTWVNHGEVLTLTIDDQTVTLTPGQNIGVIRTWIITTSWNDVSTRLAGFAECKLFAESRLITRTKTKIPPKQYGI